MGMPTEKADPPVQTEDEPEEDGVAEPAALSPESRKREQDRQRKQKSRANKVQKEKAREELERRQDDGNSMESRLAELSLMMSVESGQQNEFDPFGENTDELAQFDPFVEPPPEESLEVPSSLNPESDLSHPGRLYDQPALWRKPYFYKVLMFTSKEELNQFLAKDASFAQHFEQYLNWRKGAIVDDSTRVQKTDVLNAVSAGEAGGACKYSRASPRDRSRWTTELEWLAWLHLNLRLDLVTKPTGIFHGRNWTPEVTDERLWHLILKAKHSQKTKSKPKPPTLTQLATEVSAQNAKIRAVQGRAVRRAVQRIKSTTQARRTAVTAPSPDVAAAVDMLTKMIPSIPSEDLEELRKASVEELEEVIEDLDSAALISTAQLTGEMTRDRFGATERSEHVLRRFKDILNEAKGPSGRPTPLEVHKPAKLYWQMILLGATLFLDKPNEIKDLDRFVMVIDKLTQGWADSGEEVEDARDQAMRAADDSEEYQEQAEKLADNLKKQIARDLVPLKKQEKNADQTRMARLLANKVFERTRWAAACRALHASSRNGHTRIPLMRPGSSLFWWQITGAHALLGLQRSKWTRGGILADKVGLGKTRTCGVVMLHLLFKKISDAVALRDRSNDLSKEEYEAEAEKLGLQKPWLILAPYSVLRQWVKELDAMSAYFDLHIYHQDAATFCQMPGVRKRLTPITAPLRKDSPRLQPTVNRIKLILTTPETFQKRHGPSTPDNIRRNEMSRRSGTTTLTNDQVEELRRRYPQPMRGWEGDLHGAFEGVIVDEAHTVKNEDSVCNIALRWLDAAFVVLATATPLPSGHFNLLGYLALLEGPENRKAFRPAVDPYVHGDRSTDEHKLAMVSVDAYSRFVMGRGLAGELATVADDKDRAERLTTIFRMILVRRTYPSCVPGQEEATVIAKSLPPLRRYVVESSLGGRARDIFEYHSKMHLRRITMQSKTQARGARTGQTDRTLQTNANALRAMYGLSLNPLFGMIGIPQRHQAFSAKVITNYIETRNRINAGLKRQHNKLADRLDRRGRTLPSADDIEADPMDVDEDEDPVPEFRPFWYRDWEWSFFEVDNQAWMNWYLDHAPKNMDRYAYLLQVLLRQIRKHQDRGPDGNEMCGSQVVHEATLPDPATALGRVALVQKFIRYSPRLFNLLCVVADCLKRGEKACLWVTYPFEQIFITALLRTLGLHAQGFMAESDSTERSRIQDRFNKPFSRAEDDIQFLVCNYSVGGVGLNLQHACHVTILVDQPGNDAEGEQAIGRIYRLGQRFDVDVVQLFLENSYDRTSATRNERRVLAELASYIDAEQFDRQYLTGEEPSDTPEDLGPTSSAEGQHKGLKREQLRNFYLYDNSILVHESQLTDEMHKNKELLQVLSEGEVLGRLYYQRAGVRISEDEIGEDFGLFLEEAEHDGADSVSDEQVDTYAQQAGYVDEEDSAPIRGRPVMKGVDTYSPFRPRLREEPSTFSGFAGHRPRPAPESSSGRGRKRTVSPGASNTPPRKVPRRGSEEASLSSTPPAMPPRRQRGPHYEIDVIDGGEEGGLDATEDTKGERFMFRVNGVVLPSDGEVMRMSLATLRRTIHDVNGGGGEALITATPPKTKGDKEGKPGLATFLCNELARIRTQAATSVKEREAKGGEAGKGRGRGKARKRGLFSDLTDHRGAFGKLMMRERARGEGGMVATPPSTAEAEGQGGIEGQGEGEQGQGGTGEGMSTGPTSG